MTLLNIDFAGYINLGCVLLPVYVPRSSQLAENHIFCLSAESIAALRSFTTGTKLGTNKRAYSSSSSSSLSLSSSSLIICFVDKVCLYFCYCCCFYCFVNVDSSFAYYMLFCNAAHYYYYSLLFVCTRTVF